LLNHYQLLFAGIKEVAVIGYPDHSNKGDAATWIGQMQVLRDLGIVVMYRGPEGKCETENIQGALAPHRGSAAIVFAGGGNFGDQYWWPQFTRISVVREFFKTYPYISFPQRVRFEGGPTSEKLEIVRNAYHAVGKTLHLAAADRPSLEILVKQFAKSNNVTMSPDPVYSLGSLEHLRTPPSLDFVIDVRKDIEVGADHTVRAEWRPLATHVGLERKFTYTHGSWNDPPELNSIWDWDQRALRRAFSIFDIISRGRVLITDRLHGT